MKLNKLLQTLKAPPYELSQAQALDLLTFLLDCNREDFWLHVSDEYWGSLSQLQETLRLLKDNYPVPYILRKKYFWGTEFYVDSRVLIPRDETEGLVDLAIDWLRAVPVAQILDLGTGSGVIGLTLKRQLPQHNLYLSDNSWPALQIAQKNAQLQNLEVKFLFGEYLDPIRELKVKPNLIVTNPPYIDYQSHDYATNLKFEPSTALFATNHGLFFYQKLFSQLLEVIDLKQPTAIILEFGFNQKTSIESLFYQTPLSRWFSIDFYRDWNNHWRYLMLKVRSNVNAPTN